MSNKGSLDRGLQRLVRAVWDALIGCDVVGCRNRARAFGRCDEHLRQDWARARKIVEAQENERMEQAVLRALERLRAKGENSPNDPSSPTESA